MILMIKCILFFCEDNKIRKMYWIPIFFITFAEKYIGL